MLILYLLLVTIVSHVYYVTAVFEGCDFYQEMKPGTPYYVYSPRYPNNYPAGTNCRWYASSPPGTKIILSCENIKIPPSQNCFYDRLSVSATGDLDLNDAKNYCGQGSFTVTSTDNRMNIILLASPTSPGGTVLCNIGVVPDETPTTLPPPPSCECGKRNQMRIVGGDKTGVNEYPMMAALIDGIERRLFCGATIITLKHALTAAHCLVGKQPYETGLLVGDHKLSVGNETDAAKLYLIKEFLAHPDYNTVTQINDIAVVTVGDNMRFSREVGPACLPFRYSTDSFAGEKVEALGWGTTEFGGLSSDELQKVNLNVLTIPQCSNAYGSRVTSNQMCTFEQDKDACQSDSGGPLMWTDPSTGRLHLVGIISYGIQCATADPGVNTRITSYLDWIRRVTAEEYCVL